MQRTSEGVAVDSEARQSDETEGVILCEDALRSREGWDMCEGSVTVVRCAAGMMNRFKVRVGLQPGFAVSPFLFQMVTDRLTDEVRQESPKRNEGQEKQNSRVRAREDSRRFKE